MQRAVLRALLDQQSQPRGPGEVQDPGRWSGRGSEAGGPGALRLYTSSLTDWLGDLCKLYSQSEPLYLPL